MNKEKKEKLILMSIAAILVVVAISTFSLAALKKKINGSSGKVVYQAGDLDVVLDETGSTDIAITTAIPTKDSDGQTQTPYKFSIKNNGTAALSYEIYLDNDTDAQASCTKTKGSTCALLSDSDIRYEIKKDTARVKTLTSTRLLGSGTVAASSSDSYELKVWLNYNATNSAMGKYFFGKVRVVVKQINSGSKLKAYLTSAEDKYDDLQLLEEAGELPERDFHTYEYREKITSIVTTDTNTVPSSAIASWDLSENSDGSVMAYIEDDLSGNDTYVLVIGGTGGIVAPSGFDGYFASFSKVTSMDLTYLDTSFVNSFYFTFSNCSSLTNLDLSNFNTSNATDMSTLFYQCTSLENVDVGNFDTSNVTTMASMFSGCNNLTGVDLVNFDISNVTNMYAMFSGCGSLEILDLTSFVPSEVTEMSEMFKDTISLTKVLVSCDMLMNNPTTTGIFNNSACNDFTQV